MHKYLALILAVFALPVSAQGLIHVTGVAAAEASPDKIDVFVQLVTNGATVEQAMTENAAQLASMMTATRAAGISATDVQLSSVSVNPYEDYDTDRKPKGKRFTVQKAFVLCLRTPPKLDALLIDLSKAKAMVSNIQFVAQALEGKHDALAGRGH